MSESTVRYPELGDLGRGKPRHPEGSIVLHPSGAIYQRINGNWVCTRTPDGKEITHA